MSLVHPVTGKPLRASVQGGGTRLMEAVTPYRAADPMSQELASWWPSLGSADGDYLPWRDQTVARIRDIARNSGWAAGGVRRELDSVIGAGLRLSAKPDYQALGLDLEWSSEFARVVEARWRIWSQDPEFFCDATRQSGFGGLTALAYRHYITDGDALAVLLWLPDRGGHFASTVQIIDPDRLGNPLGEPDWSQLRGGVEMDEYGAATAYHIRVAHPNDIYDRTGDRMRWERVERETEWGRPVVVHYFDRERAGQARGIGRLAPILERLKMVDRYDRVELQAAVLNAILAAYIESPYDHEQVEHALGDGGDSMKAWNEYRDAYRQESPVTFGGVRIPTLLTGEKINTIAATRPNTAFADFERAALRNIASGIGLSYEQLTGDYSSTNYSSARAALVEIWKTLSSRRNHFAQGFCTPIYSAFLEELNARGELPIPAGAPDFYQMRAAYVRCRWLGPGRGWVDPTKEAQGAQMRMDSGLSTFEAECAEQGLDWQEVAEQQAFERNFRKNLGLPDPQWNQIVEEEQPDDRDRREREESSR